MANMGLTGPPVQSTCQDVDDLRLGSTQDNGSSFGSIDAGRVAPSNPSTSTPKRPTPLVVRAGSRCAEVVVAEVVVVLAGGGQG
jgi:hypothetical protein